MSNETKVLRTIIQLRRDTAANFEPLKDSYIPRKGEVVFVDTASGLKTKVGDGVKTFAQLGFIEDPIYDAIDSKIIRGYYLNSKFYTDSTYTVELPKYTNSIYIDANTSVLYNFNGTSFISVNDTLPNASDVTAGIMKLYQNPGQNTDGSMSQKTITDGVNAISFKVDTEDTECLILDLPWD